MESNKFFIIARGGCFIFLSLFYFNCGKEKTTTTSNPPPSSSLSSCNNCQLLYYGGNPLDAPMLDAGAYKVAARFTPTKIGNLAGKTIKEVHYYIASKPDSIRVKLYGQMDENTPGDLLYSADVTSAAEPNKWNIHTLTQPLTLKNEDIWLSIEFKIGSSRKTIGSDPGPGFIDGDWLYSSLDNQWTPYYVRSGGISINWNIRLNVAL